MSLNDQLRCWCALTPSLTVITKEDVVSNLSPLHAKARAKIGGRHPFKSCDDKKKHLMEKLLDHAHIISTL